MAKKAARLFRRETDDYAQGRSHTPQPRQRNPISVRRYEHAAGARVPILKDRNRARPPDHHVPREFRYAAGARLFDRSIADFDDASTISPALGRCRGTLP
jgi:hypothetical protein